MQEAERSRLTAQMSLLQGELAHSQTARTKADRTLSRAKEELERERAMKDGLVEELHCGERRAAVLRGELEALGEFAGEKTRGASEAENELRRLQGLSQGLGISLAASQEEAADARAAEVEVMREISQREADLSVLLSLAQELSQDLQACAVSLQEATVVSPRKPRSAPVEPPVETLPSELDDHKVAPPPEIAQNVLHPAAVHSVQMESAQVESAQSLSPPPTVQRSPLRSHQGLLGDPSVCSLSVEMQPLGEDVSAAGDEPVHPAKRQRMAPPGMEPQPPCEAREEGARQRSTAELLLSPIVSDGEIGEQGAPAIGPTHSRPPEFARKFQRVKIDAAGPVEDLCSP